MKKAQTWSTDAIVAVVLFVIGALTLFYFAGPAVQNRQAESLQDESQKLPSLLSSEQNFTASFISSSKVNEQKLLEALNLSYEVLKQVLGIRSDFCIYFEDDQGDIVPIQGRIGIGSPLVNFNGRSCNDSIAAS